MRRYVHEVFGVDVRSLALFRVCLAVLLLTDLFCRAVDLRAHYTDFGVLPRGALLSQFLNEWYLSFHFIGGSTASQYVLFSFAALWALGLLVGYRTTLMTFLSWAFLVSLHNRNSLVIDAGDIAFHLLCFWGMFLPLGARFSLDNIFHPPFQEVPERSVSPGSVALILQICFIYVFAATFKSDPVWRQTGEAVTNALNIDAFATRIGIWLLQFPELLQFLTSTTLATEAIGPFLLLVPVFTAPIRVLVILLFLGLHAGMGLCLALGIFPLIMWTGWFALLPTWFWEKLSVPSDFTPEQKQHIYQFTTVSLRIAAPVLLVKPGKLPAWMSLLKAGFCLLCLMYVFLWNLRTVNFAGYEPYFPIRYNWFGYTFRLDQIWDMFAPKPLTDDGWYVIPARLQDGTEVDLMTGTGPVHWEKPVLVYVTYRNQRWRKYLLSIWERDNVGYRPYFGRYLCRSWNAVHQGAQILQTLEIYFMKEETLPGGKVAPPEKVLLWSQSCFA